MAEECFKSDGVAIAAPETYKPVFSTTSTKSTKRDQSLTMHNSVMGTIADMTLCGENLPGKKSQQS